MSHHPNRNDYMLLGLFGLWMLSEAEEEERKRLEEEQNEDKDEEDDDNS